mgnify:CR=1 FL=1
MKVLRVKITSIVSSFRHHLFIAGVQPTLEVPPPSTVLGVISSVAGRIVKPGEICFGYVFLYRDKSEDLELIYELSLKKKFEAKSNVIKREFLTFPELYLYTTNFELERFFKSPEFPVLLGRTQELAKIDEIKTIELVKSSPVRFGHTVVPFDFKGVAGPLVSMPLYFDYSPYEPRKGRKIQPFIIVKRFINYTLQPLWFDEEKNWGIYFYGEG